jgi:hypothetical protein
MAKLILFIVISGIYFGIENLYDENHEIKK